MLDSSSAFYWIDLLEPDGPFLSASALGKDTVGQNWPSHLDAETRLHLLQPANGKAWDDSDWDGRRGRVLDLLTGVLGYSADKTLDVAPELSARHHIYGSSVSADFAVHAANDPSDLRMVVIAGPDGFQDPRNLGPRRSNRHGAWVSSPIQRAALLARHAKADLALVTNGSEHLLVNVATPTTGAAYWGKNALEDRSAQDAFVALLHRDRVLHRRHSTADLIRFSQERQQDLTDTLGGQVRRAAESAVNAISRANRVTDGQLLRDVDPAEVYSATTRVLMRIVFLLVAEERGLLPVAENQLYADEYAVTTLLDRLEDDEYQNRSVMKRHSGAWQRIMATTRAVHGGIEHQSLRLAAYGGSLFDPEEHPFLEGRVQDGDGWRQLDVGVVDDLTMLTVMRHLQIAGGQRLSYRTLDVEQIGHVYEALLDHSAVEVPDDEIILGLEGRASKEAEASLGDLERWADEGLDQLTEKMSELDVGSNPATIAKTLNAGLDSDSEVGRTLAPACRNDAEILERVHRFAPVVRTDAGGMAQVFLPGDIYVTETSSKRDSGTAYTPRSLAEEVAKHTLDPLIYDPGPNNENDDTKWRIRPPDEILDLKVCDPAVGSAAILVAAARYLAEALIQSRIEHGDLPSDALDTAISDEEALDIRVEARRDIVSNCVYGVDRDPMAAEMAKLSLWLVTMAKDRPFTFLDHAIKVGDSLLGITDIRQLRYLHMEPEQFAQDAALPVELGADSWWDTIDDDLSQVESLREKLRKIRVVDITDAERKAGLLKDAEHQSERLITAADLMVATALSSSSSNQQDVDALLTEVARRVDEAASVPDLQDLRVRARDLAGRGNPNPALPRRFLHWPLAFPEVFGSRAGFDAIVANPPFMGSQGITGNLGDDYREHVIRYVADGRKGKADLVGYFALRMAGIADSCGFLATNSIAQGDTSKVSLGPLTEASRTIYRAVRSSPWPGKAGVHISKVWLTSLAWEADANLDGSPWAGRITPTLERGGTVSGKPKSLAESAGIAFQGYQVIADGFVIDHHAAESFLSEDDRNSAIVRHYVNGDTLNGPIPRYDPNRWVIDFGTLSKREAAEYAAPFQHATEYARKEVLEKAEPDENGKSSSYERWAQRWWQFWSPRSKLRQAIEPHDQVLALAATSKVMYPVFVDSDWCLTHALIVFAYDDHGHFGILNSVFHWWWGIKPPGTGGSSLETRPRYTPTTSFQTFPQPQVTPDIERSAEDLDRHRESWIESEGVGLTEVYNRVNEPTDNSPNARLLRELHIQLDREVLDSYKTSDPHHRWNDLALDHGFYDCGSLGTRFTVSEPTRAQMLDWLLELNYRTWAKENGTTFEQVMKDTGNA